MSSRLTEKRALLERLLDRGMVMVALDARRPGVDVPAQFRGQAQLRLNLSYRFGTPIDLGAEGVTATLTFGGKPHVCRLPWDSIYQMVSHVSAGQHLFAEDIPDDLEVPEPPPPARPRFSVVDGERDEPPDDDEPPPDPAPKRGHLRRIK